MRPVHYSAHGHNSLAFGCIRAATTLALAAREKVESDGKAQGLPWSELHKLKNPVPMPRRSTSLNKVTCPECWRSILAMAKARGVR